MREKITAYKEILAAFENNIDIIESDYSIDVRSRIKARIRQLEVSEMFSIPIGNDTCGGDWHSLSQHQTISIYGEQHNRTISWLDEGIQPENEWLYTIKFPTGAYIFGEEYCTDTFKSFWDELKSYNPKYVDTANHGLYFTHENAEKMHKCFWDIFKKHSDLITDELKTRKIATLKAELETLENNKEDK